MRVQRFPFKSRRVTRKHAPWAHAVVAVDGICIAYESADEARENHGSVRVLAGAEKLQKARRKPAKALPPMVLNRWGGVTSITFRRVA